jgi:Ca2+-transporting ATPase
MKQPNVVWQQTVNLCKRGFGVFFWRLSCAFQRYGEINGEQCAASFAYYAFFSLFPLIMLLVAIGTIFVQDRERAVQVVVSQVESYLPLLDHDKEVLLNTVSGVLSHGLGAGILGFLVLAWSSLRFFEALVFGVNLAWGIPGHDWWRMPLKNLLMIAILLSAFLLGILLPLVFSFLRQLLFRDLSPVFDLLTKTLPLLLLFYSFLMFYKFAPRKPALFKHVWPGALFATVFLKFGQSLFGWYLASFSNFNAVYGVFGTIMALLLWIYVSGAVIILGGCLSATGHRREKSELSA